MSSVVFFSVYRKPFHTAPRPPLAAVPRAQANVSEDTDPITLGERPALAWKPSELGTTATLLPKHLAEGRRCRWCSATRTWWPVPEQRQWGRRTISRQCPVELQAHLTSKAGRAVSAAVCTCALCSSPVPGGGRALRSSQTCLCPGARSLSLPSAQAVPAVLTVPVGTLGQPPHPSPPEGGAE